MKKVLLALTLLLSTCFCFAEDSNTTETADTVHTVTPEELGLSSPRETFTTFLHSMNDIKRGKPERIDKATSTLDLSATNPLIREEKGRDLAWMLLEAIDKTKIVELTAIPAEKSGNSYLFAQYHNGSIRLVKLANGRWLFSQKTMSSLPAIIGTFNFASNYLSR